MLLPDEIFILILEKLDNIKQIIQLELLSKHYQKVIRNHGWNIQLYIKNDTVFEYIVNNYNFKNLKINHNCNANKLIDKIKNCHTLNLCYTNITDETVAKLRSFGCIVNK